MPVVVELEEVQLSAWLSAAAAGVGVAAGKMSLAVVVVWMLVCAWHTLLGMACYCSALESVFYHRA